MCGKLVNLYITKMYNCFVLIRTVHVRYVGSGVGFLPY